MVRLKHLAICFFIVVFVSVFPVLRNSAQVPEVAFHFTMDEINGDETMDVNGMVGILENGPAVVAGKHGNAIQFTRASEQAIEIFPDPATNFGTGDLSLEAWVKTPFDQEQSYIFNKWGPGRRRKLRAVGDTGLLLSRAASLIPYSMMASRTKTGSPTKASLGVVTPRLPMANGIMWL